MGERLVFVTIKDGPTLPSGRPLRRAVVPIDTTTSWESFQSVVMKKLRVAQIGSFYTKQGQKVGTIKDVMTVDDLEVEEIKPEATAPVTPHRRHVSMDLSSPTGSARRHRGLGGGRGGENGHASSSSQDMDENSKNKSRTGTQINLLLQKVGLKQSPGLPITNDGLKDSNTLKRGTSALRKSRKGGMTVNRKAGRSSNLSLIVGISMVLCFVMMMVFYAVLSKMQ